MGRHKEWAKSGSTPDWMDVEMALRVIADIYSGLTTATILPVGTGATGGLRVVISTTWDRLPGSPLPECVLTEADTKAYGYESLPAFVLAGIYRHENTIEIALQAAEQPG